MNEQELKQLQDNLQEARDKYVGYLKSNGYKIIIFKDYENSEVRASHNDLPYEEDIILFDLDSLLDEYEKYE